jgi:hypothetical protein
MYRDRDRWSEEEKPRVLGRRAASPVLALQRLAGNRGTSQLIARERKGSKRGTFENSVKIGDLPTIEITGGNLADWSPKNVPETLEVTSKKDKHSEKLKGLADKKTKFDEIKVQAIKGQNSWTIITIRNARVVKYTSDEKTESWKLVDFDGVHFETTSIGVPRP